MRIFLLTLWLCFGLVCAKAQQDSTKKVTITAALLYNSNISYYGQATTTTYPYVLANVTVRLPIGLYFSAGAYQLLNYEDGLSEADLGIGYELDFNEKWNMSTAYTRSFFPKNSPLLAASNQNNINLALNYNGKLFKSSLSSDYAFGQQEDFFITFINSKNVELGYLFSEKNLISIEPAIEIIAGTRHFYETYLLAEQKRNNGKGKGAGTTIITPIEMEKTNFDFLSYNFKLPISLSRANYMLEANYQLSILGNKSDTDLRHTNSIFGFAFYYQF